MESPVLRSPNGTLYKIKVNEVGNLVTISQPEGTTYTRIVLESPNATLYEVKVSNAGVLSTLNPPDADPPPADRIFVDDPIDNEYEVLVSDAGVLITDSLNYADFAPIRIWYVARNFQTGLSDVLMTVYRETSLVQADIALSEVGSTGVYTASYTPTQVGSYMIKVDSAAYPAPSVTKRDVTKTDLTELMDKMDVVGGKVDAAITLLENETYGLAALKDAVQTGGYLTI